ncbi:hypothetical protein AB4Z27_29195, partial [Cupriavidus sp. KB_39]
MVTLLLALPATSDARTVKKVIITETGQNAEPDDVDMTERCKIFQPTVAQVKRYFSKAYPV